MCLILISFFKVQVWGFRTRIYYFHMVRVISQWVTLITIGATAKL